MIPKLSLPGSAQLERSSPPSQADLAPVTARAPRLLQSPGAVPGRIDDKSKKVASTLGPKPLFGPANMMFTKARIHHEFQFAFDKNPSSPRYSGVFTGSENGRYDLDSREICGDPTYGAVVTVRPGVARLSAQTIGAGQVWYVGPPPATALTTTTAESKSQSRKDAGASGDLSAAVYQGRTADGEFAFRTADSGQMHEPGQGEVSGIFILAPDRLSKRGA